VCEHRAALKKGSDLPRHIAETKKRLAAWLALSVKADEFRPEIYFAFP
jgi:hypothetical protein